MLTEADILDGEWIDPDLGRVTVRRLRPGLDR